MQLGLSHIVANILRSRVCNRRTIETELFLEKLTADLLVFFLYFRARDILRVELEVEEDSTFLVICCWCLDWSLLSTLRLDLGSSFEN